jgi:hypothetical protein
MKSLDTKSLIIGILLALVVLLAMGAYSQHTQPGRYQLSMSTGTRGDIYFGLVDTGTGQVQTWKTGANKFKSK